MRMTILAVLMVGAAPAWSQELRSIDDTMSGISDELHATAYMTSRCSGLFDGAIAYGGQTMGEELVASFREASALMTMGTTVIRMLQAEKRGQPVPEMDAQMQQSVDETRRFSDIYHARFQSNYYLSGMMMEGDPVTTADLALCGEVAPEVRGLVMDVLGQAADE